MQEETDKKSEDEKAKIEPLEGSILSALERKISSESPLRPPQPQQKPGESESLLVGESPSLERDLNPPTAENYAGEAGETKTLEAKKKEVGASTVVAIRTYEGDVAKVIQTGASLSSIALSDERRRAERGEAKQEGGADKNKRFAIIALSAILIAGGASFLGWLLWRTYFEESAKPPVSETVVSLITANKKTIVPSTDSAKRTIEALSRARDNVSLSLGLVEELILVSGISPEAASLGSGEFLNLIEAGIGPAFLRSLDKNFFLGVHVFDGNQPVLIFKTDSYGEAFAGMLAWEKTIVRDLSPLFDTQKSLSTSTPPSFLAGQTLWRDIVVKNRDARAVYLDEEKTKLLWAIPDRKTIIIVTNPNSLIEVLSRLGNPSI